MLGLAIAGCKNNRCKEGYFCIDHECQCPPDRYEAYGVCRELEENEFYGVSSDCPCQDTFFFKILEYGDHSIRYRTYNSSNVHIESSLNYYNLPSGDIIDGSGGPFTSYFCNIDGVRTLPYFYGKFNGSNRIDVTMTYQDPRTFATVDTCHFVFRR